jgi:hypothetical protein
MRSDGQNDRGLVSEKPLVVQRHWFEQQRFVAAPGTRVRRIARFGKPKGGEEASAVPSAA